ncbi:MAG: histidinol-phosphate transaminase [Sorangiineae bacterium]|nr:histidinol-phosphate transaminase [Polyangiaceae bacterium]MEB2324622.1 histidinol-phosphate transaminase [Sorangiineae bacterium]
MPLVTPGIESLRPYEAGKPIEELARELGVTDAVKLASNENPLGPSPRAVEAARAALTEANRYPDAATYRLREKLAAHHRVGMNEVLPGNGSNELIELVIRTFTTTADHLVFAEPSFVVYRLAAVAHGTPFTAVPLRNETHDLDAMAEAVTERTKLLIVANPNNPTGTYVGRASLERLFRRLPSEVIVVMDEAYLEYADAADYVGGLELRALHERLISLRTFSKIYGLAGLRVGYAVGSAELLGYMNRVRAPFNVNSIGQVAAMAALEDVEHVTRSREVNARERARLFEALGRFAGVRVVPSQTNFLFVDFARDAREIYDALLRLGVIIRPLGPLVTSARITVGRPDENDRLLAALAQVLR